MKKQILVFFLLFILSFSSCAKATPKAQKTFFAMDTAITITVYGKNCEENLSLCEKEIYRLEKIFDALDPDSELARLNASTGEVQISDELSEVLSLSLQYADATEGNFDPTLLPLSQIWGFYDQNYRIPEAGLIRATKEKCGYEKVMLRGNSVRLPEGTKLDFGAIVKGYASHKLTEILKESGADAAILSLGGNVQALGSKPDGAPWLVGIQDPVRGGETALTLSLNEKAVVTSGSYQRFFEKDGVRYCHIIDSKTGAPVVSPMTSLTVVSSDPTKADALSTALFVGGEDAVLRALQADSEIGVIMIFDDEKIMISENLEDSIVYDQTAKNQVQIIERTSYDS